MHKVDGNSKPRNYTMSGQHSTGFQVDECVLHLGTAMHVNFAFKALASGAIFPGNSKVEIEL